MVNTDDERILNKVPLITVFGHCHTKALHNGRKVKIREKHHTIKMSG